MILELKNQSRDVELTKILQRSFPALQDLSIQFDDVTDRYITVSYQEQGRPKEFDIFSAGSGFQQFLYLFGFILLRTPTLVMLDEPDVHLHGSLQAVLLEELRRLVDDGRQVLFATHSRELITRVSPENILSLSDDGARRLHVAFDVYDALDRLGSIDPTQLATIQAYRRVVILEDDSDRSLLTAFCSKSLGADKWQQIERRLAFCYSKGNPWKQLSLDRLRQMLQQMITIGGQSLRMFVIADRDYHPDVPALELQLGGPNLDVHVWRRTEIENYLLNITAIRRLLRQRESEMVLDEQSVQSEFDRLIEVSRPNADDGLVQAYDEMRRRQQERWDAATMNRKAREFLDEHWDQERLDLADAKDVVLPGIKRWLQKHGISAFSDHKLAETFQYDDLPNEIHDVAKRLAVFAGVEE
ncbi:MAG: ATP-dependent endonuclease [Planctomycetaceae bacterium]